MTQTSPKPRRTTRAAPSRQRGGVYLAVLGASMIITILGVAGLFAVRIQGKVTATANDAVRAVAASASAVELGRYRIANDASWRARHTNDTWVTDVTLDGAKITYKLVDEADADLNNDATQPVRLHARAAVGNALRMQSVQLTPDGTGKMIPIDGSWRQEILP